MTDQRAQADGHDSRAVANRFIELAEARGATLTILPLVKFVYLAHGWHLGLFHRPLICHAVEAWKYGPVVPEVYEAFCPPFPKRVREPVEKAPEYQDFFTEDEEMVIAKTYGHYSKMHPYSLSELTHQPGTPWDKVRNRGHYALIPNGLIEEYYSRLIRKRTTGASHGKQ